MPHTDEIALLVDEAVATTGKAEAVVAAMRALAGALEQNDQRNVEKAYDELGALVSGRRVLTDGVDPDMNKGTPSAAVLELRNRILTRIGYPKRESAEGGKNLS